MKRFYKLIATLALVAAPSNLLPLGEAMAAPSNHPSVGEAIHSKDYSLVVYTADGTRTAYAFGDLPKLTISGSTFTITTGVGTDPTVCPRTDYAVSDLLRFTLEDGDGASVSDAYWLVISLRDGTIEGYPFTDRPKITIKDDLFSVITAARTIDYAATSIDRFRVTDQYESGDANPLQQAADVNGDGTVDVADIATVISVMAGGK